MIDPANTHSFTYRIATLDDALGILNLLAEVAPEIPMSLDTEDEKRLIQISVGECCLSGKSWIALDVNGTVVGAILVRQDTEDFAAISLQYIAVGEASRGNGIFSVFISKVKSEGVPLTATVLSGNKSHMIDRLFKKGFLNIGADARKVNMRWDPPVVGQRVL